MDVSWRGRGVVQVSGAPSTHHWKVLASPDGTCQGRVVTCLASVAPREGVGVALGRVDVEGLDELLAALAAARVGGCHRQLDVVAQVRVKVERVRLERRKGLVWSGPQVRLMLNGFALKPSLRSEPMPVGICSRAPPSDGIGVTPACDVSDFCCAGAAERETAAPRSAPAQRVRPKPTKRFAPPCAGCCAVVRGRESMARRRVVTKGGDTHALASAPRLENVILFQQIR